MELHSLFDAGSGVIRHQGVSDSSNGARPLRLSHSAGKEYIFADVECLSVIDLWPHSMTLFEVAW